MSLSKRFQYAANKSVSADWWDAGESVTIKKLTWLDMQQILEAAAEIKNEQATGAKASISFHIARYNIELMRRGIASWTFAGADGSPVPINDQFIGMLDSRDGDFIINAIQDFNPEMRRSAEEAGFQKADPA